MIFHAAGARSRVTAHGTRTARALGLVSPLAREGAETTGSPKSMPADSSSSRSNNASAHLGVIRRAVPVSHLDRRLDLLVGHRRAPARHRSHRGDGGLVLRAAGPGHPALLERLGVVEGRFTAEAAHESHPALGRHLREAVRTGTWCTYRPETPIHWQL